MRFWHSITICVESSSAIKGVSSLECNAGSSSIKVCCHLCMWRVTCCHMCMWGVYLVPSKACEEISVAIKGMTSSSYYIH